LGIALGWRWVGALSRTGWVCLHTRTGGLGHRLRRNLWWRAALVLCLLIAASVIFRERIVSYLATCIDCDSRRAGGTLDLPRV